MTNDLRDQALARLAAVQMEMRERCAKWHDEVVAHDQGGIDYSNAVGVPISNRYELEQSVKAHEYSAREIRAIPIDLDAEAALQRAVDATWNEAVEACLQEAITYDDMIIESAIRALKRPEASHE